eukprot:gene17687-biopygen3831
MSCPGEGAARGRTMGTAGEGAELREIPLRMLQNCCKKPAVNGWRHILAPYGAIWPGAISPVTGAILAPYNLVQPYLLPGASPS